jgi:hypothetical protein
LLQDVRESFHPSEKLIIEDRRGLPSMTLTNSSEGIGKLFQICRTYMPGGIDYPLGTVGRRDIEIFAR